ncbi:MAG: pyridoxamine 5'-phosphate oxidase [Acidimicrobiales bacterium]
MTWPRTAGYGERGLDTDEVAEDPFTQFQLWFEEWAATDPYDPTAVALATADETGRPSVRFVLLKGVDHGFVFFTNYGSRKGRELASNPQASLCFGWIGLERQVRAVGAVQQVSEDESDAYFASRPRGSQLGAWASDQSRPVADRAALERRWADTDESFPDDDVPRPPYWGGYRLVPDEVEFWQGRPNRMHDRLAYLRTAVADPWTIERLQP